MTNLIALNVKKIILLVFRKKIVFNVLLINILIFKLNYACNAITHVQIAVK